MFFGGPGIGAVRSATKRCGQSVGWIVAGVSVAMLPFETTSVTVAYRQRCEDRVKVVELDGGVVIIVADGAGGTGAGAEAAETVIREVTAAASLERDAEGWCDVLRQTDHRIGAGESTCVVVARSARGLVGAGVGDSKAWLLETEIIDLTASQVRKPLLGSGEARPVGFSRSPSPGLLLACTDGFCNYVRRETLLREILWIDFAVLPRKLVEMVRLPSGELWDDVGIVACRPRRPGRSRDRYEITEAD
jgi:serine/threonine protein phosphatase PrpC